MSRHQCAQCGCPLRIVRSEPGAKDDNVIREDVRCGGESGFEGACRAGGHRIRERRTDAIIHVVGPALEPEV